jgi:hypothetical protein
MTTFTGIICLIVFLPKFYSNSACRFLRHNRKNNIQLAHGIATRGREQKRPHMLFVVSLGHAGAAFVLHVSKSCYSLNV